MEEMRRRLMRFLPVFLLALTVQVLAPIGACLASAMVASDPLAAAVLCQGSGSDHGSGVDPQSGHDMRRGSCAVCSAVAPFAPPAPPSVSAEVARYGQRVAWHAFASDARAAKIAIAAQARAPPVSS